MIYEVITSNGSRWEVNAGDVPLSTHAQSGGWLPARVLKSSEDFPWRVNVDHIVAALPEADDD